MRDRFVGLFLLTAVFGALAATLPSRAAAAPVPFVHCITPNTAGTSYWVYFGYSNTGALDVYDFGDFNQVVPGLGFQGQPIYFNTGIYPTVFRAIFNTVAFPAISWELAGSSASATLDSPKCLAGRTGPATAITAGGATLTARLEPDAGPTSYHFEYGTTPALGQSTPVQQVTTSAELPVSEAISGLQPATTYYFRLEATNSLTSTVGEQGTFTTAAPPVAPKSVADLSLTQAVTPISPTPGELTTLAATIENAGPGVATAAMATFTLPAAATVDTPSLPADCTVGVDGYTVACALATVGAGATVTRAIGFRMPVVGAARILGSVSTLSTDEARANDSAISDYTVAAPPLTPQGDTGAPPAPLPPANLPVPPANAITPSAALADLVVTRTGARRAIRVGRTVTLHYAVKNVGQTSADGAVLTVRLARGVTKLRVKGATCTGRRTVRCTLGSLAPAATKTVSVRVRVRSRARHADVATVVSTGADATSANNVVEGVVRGRR